MSVSRSRTPRMASVLAGIALGATVLTTAPTATAAPVVHTSVSQAAKAATTTPAEQTVTRLSLSKASAGTTILVHGTKLATAASDGSLTAKTVKFGDKTVDAQDVTALSTRVLQVKVPTTAQGTVLVTVGDAVKGPKFTYVATVTTTHNDIKGLAVTSEKGLAGQTIVGDHFSKATKVLVGGKGVKLDKTTPISADGTTIKFDYPAGLIGVQDVVVTDNGATYYIGYVTYTATKITVSALDFDTVFVEAPTTLKVTGTELDNVASVVFTYGDKSDKVSFKADKADDTKATVTVPKGVAAEGKLEFTTKYGETASIDLDRVAAAKPTVTAISAVTAAGGEATLTGTNLRGLKAVTIYSTTTTVKKYTAKVGEVAADGKTAKITVPKLLDNAKYQVDVTTVYATASDKLDFTVGTPLVAPAVTTATGADAGTAVTIVGTDLASATKVELDTDGVVSNVTSGITANTATGITVTVPALDKTKVFKVKVTTAGGASAWVTVTVS